MAHASTTTAQPDATETRRKEPSVLVVLVAHDGLPWLRECLRSLSRQTHPRLGIVAVDNASDDGSRDLLEQALGPDRVIALPRNAGLPGAVQAGLKVDAAERADYLLILHDDTALDPEAVARMVEAAERVDGVGVVGPKVLDWEDPRVLREVGQSTDGFGYPYSPLEEDEIDHGQYDRVREVLFVSSAAMLVSRAAWKRAGVPDERLDPYLEDLDFCWRARLAGFRVLMSPQAKARHRSAAIRGERRDGVRVDRQRLYAERASLAAMLKNYGLLTLLWILPLYTVQALGKTVVWAVTRRFEEAWQVVVALLWNVAHLPGTIRRRIRAQAVRSVPDRAVRRYMAPAGLRLRRWADTAGALFRRTEEPALDEERPVDEQEELVLPTLGARTMSLARAHPVATAWAAFAVLAFLAYRPLWGHAPLTGGALPSFPAAPTGFFHEFLSGYRTTVLGGADPASPALGMLGLTSAVTFASTAVAQKLLLMALPPLAARAMYRLVLRRTNERIPAVAAGAVYGLSATVLWALSEGRIAALAALVVLPSLVDRLERGFSPNRPGRPLRFLVDAGLVLAVGLAFFPGVILAFALFAVACLLVPSRRGEARGVGIVAGAVVVGLALAFPMVLASFGGPGPALHSTAGRADFASLVRLSPGPATGSWSVAWFVPVAALVSFTLADRERRRTGLRLLLVSVAGVTLAWLSAAGYLSAPLSNPTAYLAAAAVADCALIGLGVTAAIEMGRRAFGYRQLAGIGVSALVAGGLVLQAVEAATGGWAIGTNQESPSWPLVASADPGSDFRVLWLGGPSGDPFPAPGGDAITEGSASGITLRYTVTDRNGASALDTGRGFTGDGYRYLERSLSQILSGNTTHGGALLGPLGVEFLVAGDGDLPREARLRLDAQVDMDLVPTSGLVIYRNERVYPQAGATSQRDFAAASGSTDLLPVATLPKFDGSTLPPVAGGFQGDSPGGVALLARQFDGAWRLRSGGHDLLPARSFGWATRFRAPPGPVQITYAGQGTRDLEVALLAALWLAALWITRKPVRR
ncbi:MAG TPA: glycosyltransferase family 2 protein [Actinomycetota bacterium]|jgi:GT2 family glycosyltransferase